MKLHRYVIDVTKGEDCPCWLRYVIYVELDSHVSNIGRSGLMVIIVDVDKGFVVFLAQNAYVGAASFAEG